MKSFIIALAGGVALAGCSTGIKAPEQTYPVFGPYMTRDGNLCKNPLDWGRATVSPSIVWDAAEKEYVIVFAPNPADPWDPTKVSAVHHFLLNEILVSSSCTKFAFDANGKAGVFPGVHRPSVGKGTDGTWRMCFSALSAKDDENSRRIAVLESEQDRAWSPYAFKGWLEGAGAADDPWFFTAPDGTAAIAAVERGTDGGASVVLRDLATPLAVGGRSVRLAAPDLKGCPTFVQAPNGRAFLLYLSGSNSVKALALEGKDIFAASAWKPLGRPVLEPGADVRSLLSVSAFVSSDGKETWLVYATLDPKAHKSASHAITGLQKLAFAADGSPVSARADDFGVWKRCPSGEPPVQVTR